MDVLGARSYFDELFKKTGYSVTKALRDKIAQIELSEFISSEPQQKFLSEHKEYLEHIENYSIFEFELLNHGRSLEDVKKEVTFLKKNIHL